MPNPSQRHNVIPTRQNTLSIEPSEMSLTSQAVHQAPHISIVATMYRSRPFLERLLAECLQALAELDCTEFEILLVNDGSPDDSLAYAVSRRTDIAQLV